MEDAFEKFVEVAVRVEMLIEKLSTYGDVTKLDLRHYRIDRRCIENSDNNTIVSEEINNMNILLQEINSTIELVSISKKAINKVKSLKNNCKYSQVFVEDILKYFLIFKKSRKKSSQSFKMDLKEFYNSLYQVVEVEMREKASSQLLDEIQKEQVDILGISSVLEKKVKRVINEKSFEDSIYYGKLSSMYSEFLKGNNDVISDMIIVSLLVEEEAIMNNAINRRLGMLFFNLEYQSEKIKKSLYVSNSNIEKAEDLSNCNSEINERGNSLIGKRISAIALSIALLGALNVGLFKSSLENLTTIEYGTKFERIIFGENDEVVDTYESKSESLMRELTPEERFVLTNYSNIFSEDGKKYRYAQDYLIDYVEGSYDYAKLDYRNLKPIGTIYKDFDAAREYDGINMRSIEVYSQNYDDPHVKRYVPGVIGFSLLLAMLDLILFFYVPFMPYDDYKAIKKILRDKKDNDEKLAEKVNYLLVLIRDLEKQYREFSKVKGVYLRLVKLVNELGLNVDDKDLDSIDYYSLIEQQSEQIKKLVK